MGMRELVIEAIRMRNSGKSKTEIDRYLRRESSFLGICTEEDNGDWYTLRLTATGEIVRCDQNGYSYSASG
jgi:hypothetical protein